MKEEAEEEQRKRRQHPPPKAIDRWTLRDRTWKYISDICEGKTVCTSTYQLVSRKMPFQAEVRHLTVQVGELGSSGKRRLAQVPGHCLCSRHPELGRFVSTFPFLEGIVQGHWISFNAAPCTLHEPRPQAAWSLAPGAFPVCFGAAAWVPGGDSASQPLPTRGPSGPLPLFSLGGTFYTLPATSVLSSLPCHSTVAHHSCISNAPVPQP